MRALKACFLTVVVLFLTLPVVVVVVVSFSASPVFELPREALSLRWYQNLLSVRGLSQAVLISLQVAAIACLASVVLGAAGAWGIVRGNLPYRHTLATLLLSPLMIPALVFGIAALYALRSIGFSNSFWSLVLSHTILATPFALRVILARLGQFDFALVDAARTLGCRPSAIVPRVLIPTLFPAVVGAAGFSFIASFDNYALALFLSDSRTQTLPIKILQYMELSPDPTLAAICTVMLAFSVLLVVVIDRSVGLRSFN